MQTDIKRQFELKQVALVAEDIESALSDLTNVLGLSICVRNLAVEQFGLVNALMAFGETFIEVVSPSQPNTAAGRLLDKRKGNGGYMVLVQTDDLKSHKNNINIKGIEAVYEANPDGVKLMHLHPKELGAILSFDELELAEHWIWAGDNYKEVQGSELVNKITGVVIQGDDPQKVAQKWAAAFNLPFDEVDNVYSLNLDDGIIRFEAIADGRGPGVSGVILNTKNPDEILSRAANRNLIHDKQSVIICGTKFYV
ncbi:MAG: hypothetical protein COA96_05040 [SAR86 cluster bacterium]|uniref:Glyoxalase-like domain-containing protein n=1 Tax=SAR86 cluster bacterium TaxID=2030880 RepID=A0A2A5B6M4_9GAMM|nr:MAG: hypothetical protein COA96_05040 [SAR86 cluster bacterium]